MCTGVHLLQFLNAVICSLITPFFKCIKLHQILSQFSIVNLAQALGINIFRGDYSNLNIFILSKNISLQYTKFIVENMDHIWCSKKEGLFWHYVFKKNILPRIFCNLVPKESFVPKCTSSINFRSQMKLWQRIYPVDDYCQQLFKCVLYILGSSKIFKMLVKEFENIGKNISKNIVKLNFKQKINLYCIFIWSTYV